MPLNANGMHELSKKFLENMNVNLSLHFPKLIKKDEIDSQDILIAIDYEVQHELQKTFSSDYQIINASVFSEEGNIRDPIRMKKEEYFKVMKQIVIASKKICKYISDNYGI